MIDRRHFVGLPVALGLREDPQREPDPSVHFEIHLLPDT